jgi:2-oxoglutarate ferredoxin oxidoreductase subunit beta
MPLKILNQLAEKGDAVRALESDKRITWCSNCGNFGIQNALIRALVLEDLKVEDVVHCFDVGCSGNGSDKIELYTIHGLHGRVLPLAAGIKIANPRLKVIASAGDGATFSEGVNHLVHAVRNNFPILFIHHNNENYGLTTGQASSTTPKGARMNSAPTGVTAKTINTIDFVLSLKPSWVARSYTGEVDHITEMLRQGLRHDGFAFLEILQACPTYNKETPDEWYAEKIQYLQDSRKGARKNSEFMLSQADSPKIKKPKLHDPEDLWAARKLADDQENPYVGLIYHDPKELDFLALQDSRKGIKTAPVDEVKPFDISTLI